MNSVYKDHWVHDSLGDVATPGRDRDYVHHIAVVINWLSNCGITVRKLEGNRRVQTHAV